MVSGFGLESKFIARKETGPISGARLSAVEQDRGGGAGSERGARWASVGRAERKGERKKMGRAKEKERRRSWARLLGWAQKREGERKGFTFFKKI